jgi:hypothetical protein
VVVPSLSLMDLMDQQGAHDTIRADQVGAAGVRSARVFASRLAGHGARLAVTLRAEIRVDDRRAGERADGVGVASAAGGGSWGTGGMMGIITERDSAADGYEAVNVPPAPDQAALRKAALYTATESGGSGAILRRRSALPTRRSVLYLHCDQDTFVPEDLVTWYTERGFHFYVADLRPQDRLERPGRQRGHGPGRGDCFAGLDAACRHLRDTEGIDMIIMSAHSADAVTAALWCDARRDAGLADALILSSPVFGRRLRRALDIACPVLVMSPAGDPEAQGGPSGRLTARLRRRNEAATVRLGPHVTWLRLEDGLGGDAPGASADRRRFFDELGRWLGAYMYGQVRDQLL